VEVIPSDLVLVGHVTDAWGLRGGIRIAPYSQDADALLGTKEWWFTQPGSEIFTRSFLVNTAKVHGESVTAELVGVADRNFAESLRGSKIAIPRSRFPILADGEYYWIDLIGHQVINLAGESLGQVSGLMDNGAHQILQVQYQQSDDSNLKQERLIPFVDAFVRSVDMAGKRIVVDWGLDY